MDETGRLREGSGIKDGPSLEEGVQGDLQPIRTGMARARDAHVTQGRGHCESESDL